MSMPKQYDPYENAVADFINRTLKYEYGLKQTIKKGQFILVEYINLKYLPLIFHCIKLDWDN